MSQIDKNKPEKPDKPDKPQNPGQGPKYFVTIEGKEYPWPRDEITTEEIATLGGFAAGEGVIEIDDQQDERTLSPGDIIKLKPGHGFGKKFAWQRG